MDISQTIQKIADLAEPGYSDRIAGFGIDASKALGVRMPQLRALAKEIGKHHALAMRLWEEDIHEAKLLAILLLEHKKLKVEEMERMVKDFYSWDLVDQACTIFCKHPKALEKADEWRMREPEFQRRAGIVMLVAITVHHKKMPDEELLPFFDKLMEHACDERNFVKKAVNWLLRQLGKRSLFLHPYAIACGEIMLEKDCPAAKWSARDALRELRSEKVLERLRVKEARKRK